VSSEMEALKRRLQALEDRQAIEGVLRDIARGVDRFDQALLAARILPEAVIDMGGDAPMTGAAFVAGLKPPEAPPLGRMHLVGNVRIVLQADEAASEAQVISYMTLNEADGPATRIRAGRYLDRFQRGAAGWRLSARLMIDEWGRIDPVNRTAPQGWRRGAPAPLDPTYEEPGL
jgi:hypothetical protein